MMDRNREARRGAMAAVNGGGLSRRRQQRTTNLRDSPEEDGAIEMQQEPSRLRDRGIKKDRDRDRERSSSRSKRRRGERSMHSNREGDDSSEESIEDDDDDEEEGASVTVRLPMTLNSAQIPSSSSSIQQQNHHHVVKKSSFLANNNGKPVRPPAPSWKVAEEMIGVSIPRKARSSSLKRSQECGDVIHRQASTSPARPSPSSTTVVSPSSSNASVRRKKISSGAKQHRLPKIAKSSSAASSIQEIEIEVAEVLYGMTRQAAPLVNKQENCKVDSKDMEVKSSVCSPNSISQQQSNFPSSSSPMVASAPKRKRPRLKFDEERPASPSTKTESELPAKTEEVSSPKSEKNTSASPAIENGVASSNPGDAQQDSAKPGSCNQVPDSKVSTDGGEEGVKKEDVAISSLKPMEAPHVDTNINHEEATAAAKVENLIEEKFSIDLMAPPLPEKSSSDKDGLLDFVSDHRSLGPEKKMLPSLDIAIGETEKVLKQEGTVEHAGNFLAQDIDLKKQALKEKIPDLQLDLGKHDKDGLSLSAGSKQQQQVPKQQQKSARIDPKQEKSAPLTSMPLPVPIAGWPGGFPSFGYMGQVPSLQAVVPMDGSLGAAKTVQQPQPAHFLQPKMRPKRCATHCYIAQNIHYHQQIARMHPFWPAAAAAAAVNVAKQYNLNAVPPSDSAAIVGNPLQGGFPPLRNSGPLQDKSASSVAMACTGPPPKEKSSATAASAPNSNTFMEAAQRKQFLLPQSSQPGSSAAAPPNMIHGPAFLFPINQQPAVANHSGAPSKPTPPTGNAAPSSIASTSSAVADSGAAGHSTTTMCFNHTGLSPEAQYMTILQNNAILPNPPYPFPLATAHVGGPPPFRGTVHAQAMPFFNGPFYSSQMAPSRQQQQLLLMQQHQQQPNHQNPSTSSGSSSSQKHNTQQQQQQRGPGGSNSHSFPPSKQPLHLLPHQARQIESEATCEDSPSTADSSRASQASKGIYGQNFAVPMHSQNFGLISPAPTAGGSHGENKQPPVAAHQHQALKVDLTPSQAYAMSFASFGGSAAAAATPGLDFSAIVQNPAMLQNLPEVARRGCPPAVAMAAAAAAAAAVAQQAVQHKKSHHEDGKSVGETTAANANAAADDGKIATVTAAAKNVAQQHSLSFSRSDNDPTASNIMSNHADATSRALNLLHQPVNGTQASNPSSAAPSTAVTNSSSTLPLPLSQSKQQYYHQMLQFQHQHSQQQQQQQQRMLYMQHQQHQQQPPQLSKEQQQQLHHQQMLLQQQMASCQQMMSRTGKPSSAHNASSSSNISSTTSARFPQGGLAGVPPSLIQGGSSSSTSQSPQWKNSSTNRAANPVSASSATSSSSSAKNQIPQQQQPTKQKQQQPPVLNPNAHHKQISFGVSTSSNKPSISSSAAATAIAAGSPQNSVSKSSAATGGGGNGGSPRASSTSKSVQPPVSMLPTLPLQQQQATAKSSPSAAVSSLKPSSPITNNSCTNRNMTTSILGHPHITPSNSSSGKKLQPHQQQSQKQQPFQQPQLFFNNPYIQAQTSQRRQTEQPNSTATTTTTSGMISLTPASLTLAGGASTPSDPTKAAAAAASNIKGLTTQQQQQADILQHGTQFAPATSMGPNPFMYAAFNYVQVMSPSSVSVKPASTVATAPEQKQSTATGNENVHACWKPEKR